MTLKRKILLLISCLSFFVVLAMSGMYYRLFSNYIELQSQERVDSAFNIIFDDLKAQTRDSIGKIDTLSQTSLAGPLYLSRMYQEQYADLEAWSAREVRKMMTYLNPIVGEIRRFGELIGAQEILVYDRDKTLLALYRHGDDGALTGMYFPQLFEDQFIPMKPGADWFMRLKDIEDIPRQPLGKQDIIRYQETLPETPGASLTASAGKVMSRVVVPIMQKGTIAGVCVLKMNISQADIERYSRLSRTRVNLFAGTTLSVGMLPEYRELSENNLKQSQLVNFAETTESSAFISAFSEKTINGQQYYQGMLALGNHDVTIGALTVFYPRLVEEEAKRKFLMAVGAIILFFGVVTAFCASLLSTVIVKPILQMTTLLEQFAQGNLNSLKTSSAEWTTLRSTPRRSKNELVLLSRSFYAMEEYLREMASVAEQISRGEIEQNVAPRSEQDVLGNAFARMTSYLKTIAAVATALSHGDLRRQITPQTEHDLLGHAFSRLESLRQAMHVIMQEAEHVGTSSEELTLVSSQMATGAQQSSQKIQEIASSSDLVSKTIGEVAISTREMTANIREISLEADEVSDVVETAVITAKAAGTTMSDLDMRSEEIGKIIKVITAITKQTNLLALNATIEAARAGESGKGFAVVASEVKELARQITASAEDITHKVEAIQASSQKATAAISHMSEHIEVIQSFMNIIVSSITEQSAATEQIMQNLSESAHGSEVVSAAIAEVAEFTQHSSSLARKVKTSAANQTSIAEQLRQSIHKFQI